MEWLGLVKSYRHILLKRPRPELETLAVLSMAVTPNLSCTPPDQTEARTGEPWLAAPSPHGLEDLPVFSGLPGEK